MISHAHIGLAASREKSAEHLDYWKERLVSLDQEIAEVTKQAIGSTNIDRLSDCLTRRAAIVHNITHLEAEIEKATLTPERQEKMRRAREETARRSDERKQQEIAALEQQIAELDRQIAIYERDIEEGEGIRMPEMARLGLDRGNEGTYLDGMSRMDTDERRKLTRRNNALDKIGSVRNEKRQLEEKLASLKSPSWKEKLREAYSR